MIIFLITYLIGGVATLIALISWSLIYDSTKALEMADVAPSIVLFSLSWIGVIIVCYLWNKEIKNNLK